MIADVMTALICQVGDSGIDTGGVIAHTLRGVSNHISKKFPTFPTNIFLLSCEFDFYELIRHV